MRVSIRFQLTCSQQQSQPIDASYCRLQHWAHTLVSSFPCSARVIKDREVIFRLAMSWNNWIITFNTFQAYCVQQIVVSTGINTGFGIYLYDWFLESCIVSKFALPCNAVYTMDIYLKHVTEGCSVVIGKLWVNDRYVLSLHYTYPLIAWRSKESSDRGLPLMVMSNGSHTPFESPNRLSPPSWPIDIFIAWFSRFSLLQLIVALSSL